MKRLVACVFAVLAVSVPDAARAAPCTATWNNPAGGNWNDHASWTDGDADPNNNVPSSGDVACIELPGTYTVVLEGLQGSAGGGLQLGNGNTADGSPTLVVRGTTDMGNPAGMTLGLGESEVRADGIVELSTTGANPGFASLSTGTNLLTNRGTIRTVPGAGTAQDLRYLSGTYLNEATGRIEVGETVEPFNTHTLVNRGAIAVTDGETFNVAHSGAGPAMRQEGGTIAGRLVQFSGTHTVVSGTVTGGPVELCATSLDASGAGAAAYRFIYVAGNCGSGKLIGDIAADKTVEVAPSASVLRVTTEAPLTNAGTLILTGAGDAQLSGATLTNTGTLRVAPGGPRFLAPGLVNTGTVELQTDTRCSCQGLTWTNQGVFAIGAKLDAPALALVQAGGVLGAGELTVGTLDNAGGAVAPNGTLALTGDYTQSAGGTLAIDAAADRLAMTGKATLGGALAATGGAAAGQKVLTATSRTGEFATVTPPFSAVYSATDVTLAGGAAADTDPPETRIGKAPRKRGTKRKVRFTFTSDEAGATFECKLDKGAFKACAGAFSRKVKRGRHTFQVRARDAAGNVDPTPAKRTFRVVRKKKR